jgi:anti-sigma factor RsiW
MNESRVALENACADYEADLVLYYYGDASDDDRRRVEQHLSACARCSRFLNDLRGLLPQMAAKTELPDNFWNDYYREMVQKLDVERQRKSWWRNLLPDFSGWAVPAFGTAMVLVLAVTMMFGEGDWSVGPAEQAEEELMIPQEILSDSSRLEFFKSLDMLESLCTFEKKVGARGD